MIRVRVARTAAEMQERMQAPTRTYILRSPHAQRRSWAILSLVLRCVKHRPLRDARMVIAPSQVEGKRGSIPSLIALLTLEPRVGTIVERNSCASSPIRRKS